MGAMGQVLFAHARLLEEIVVRLAGPGPDTDDILQATFLAAIGAFPSFRGHSRVSTWLARIAINVTIDALRKRRRRAIEPVEVDDLPADCCDAEEVVQMRAELARLHGLLDELAPMRRVAFVLHVLEQRDVEEVAALTGASIVATKSRIFWARRTLLRRARLDPVLRGRFSGGGR